MRHVERTTNGEVMWICVMAVLGICAALLVSRCDPCEKWVVTHWVGGKPVSACVKWKDGNP